VLQTGLRNGRQDENEPSRGVIEEAANHPAVVQEFQARALANTALSVLVLPIK
jgi:hypothetical protein